MQSEDGHRSENLEHLLARNPELADLLLNAGGRRDGSGCGAA